MIACVMLLSFLTSILLLKKLLKSISILFYNILINVHAYHEYTCHYENMLIIVVFLLRRIILHIYKRSV